MFQSAGAIYESLGFNDLSTVKQVHYILIKPLRPALAGALKLEGLVAGHGTGPGWKICTERVRLCLVANGEEGVLDDILCVAEVRLNGKDIIQNNLLVLDEESLHLKEVVGGGRGICHAYKTADVGDSLAGIILEKDKNSRFAP